MAELLRVVGSNGIRPVTPMLPKPNCCEPSGPRLRHAVVAVSVEEPEVEQLQAPCQRRALERITAFSTSTAAKIATPISPGMIHPRIPSGAVSNVEFMNGR